LIWVRKKRVPQYSQSSQTPSPPPDFFLGISPTAVSLRWRLYAFSVSTSIPFLANNSEQFLIPLLFWVPPPLLSFSPHCLDRDKVTAGPVSVLVFFFFCFLFPPHFFVNLRALPSISSAARTKQSRNFFRFSVPALMARPVHPTLDLSPFVPRVSCGAKLTPGALIQ